MRAKSIPAFLLCLALVMAAACGGLKDVSGYYTGAPTGVKLTVNADDDAARAKVRQEVGFLAGRFRIFRVELDLRQAEAVLSGQVKLSAKGEEFKLHFKEIAGALEDKQVRLEGRTQYKGHEVVLSFAGRSGGDGLVGELRLLFNFKEMKATAEVAGGILWAGPARSGFGI